MRNTLSSISDFFNYYFSFNIPNIHAIDVIEIIIIAFFFYQILVWFKNTRAWMLFRGVMIIIAFFIVAAALQMNTILWL